MSLYQSFSSVTKNEATTKIVADQSCFVMGVVKYMSIYHKCLKNEATTKFIAKIGINNKPS